MENTTSSIKKDEYTQSSPELDTMGLDTSFLPSQNGGPISKEVAFFLSLINVTIIGTAMAIFGLVANVINIIVFIHQGFHETINISLSALAISDFLSQLTFLWQTIAYNPLLVNADVSFISVEVEIPTGAIPHAMVINVTCWLTAFITFERCVCVVFPLKVKDILTPSRTKVIVAAIFVLVSAAQIPVIATMRLDWKFVPARNKTMLGLVFLEGSERMMEIVFYIVNVFSPIATFTIVTLCTAMLVVKLMEKSKWRQLVSVTANATTTSTTSNQQQPADDNNDNDNDGGDNNTKTKIKNNTNTNTKTNTSTNSSSNTNKASNRDKKVVRMVVAVAAIFIATFFPTVVLSTFLAKDPQAFIGVDYDSFIAVALDIAVLTESINGSVNIFVYYSMSSKYKQVFSTLFRRCRGNDDDKSKKGAAMVS